MSLIQKPGSLPPCSWPNKETLTTSTKVAINLTCYLINTPLTTTAAINFPIRCFSIYQSSQSKRHYKAPLDIAAFLILPFPHGILFSIGIDTISEVINFYKGRANKPSQDSPTLSSSKRLDPKNFDNACKILGIELDEIKNRSKINENYTKILKGYQERKSKASGPIANGLQELIDDVEQAYQTLISNS